MAWRRPRWTTRPWFSTKRDASPGRPRVCEKLVRGKAIRFVGACFKTNSHQWEVLMKFLLTALAFSLVCFMLVRVALAGDAKPVKKTIRAEDELPIVCEVRGKGDTALIFLHGWCGDRAYWKNQA